MVQVPAATMVTVEVATVHTGVVNDERVTARFELAVAETGKAGSRKVLLASALNVIAWLPFVTAKLCVACAAGLYCSLPPWLAAMVQVPTATSVTLVSATVHTAGVSDENVMGKFEVT